MFREACVVRSEVWEVIANLEWVAFGTPMFSRRLDAGYFTSRLVYHRVTVSLCKVWLLL